MGFYFVYKFLIFTENNRLLWYNQYGGNSMENDLKKLVDNNEKILYEGKPNKKCFIFESIFNPLMPLALIWAIIDFGVIGVSILADGSENVLFF